MTVEERDGKLGAGGGRGDYLSYAIRAYGCVIQ